LFPWSNVTANFDRAKYSITLGSVGTGKVYPEVVTPVWAVDPCGHGA
jgi:hypothetical protein